MIMTNRIITVAITVHINIIIFFAHSSSSRQSLQEFALPIETMAMMTIMMMLLMIIIITMTQCHCQSEACCVEAFFVSILLLQGFLLSVYKPETLIPELSDSWETPRHFSATAPAATRPIVSPQGLPYQGLWPRRARPKTRTP